MLLVFNHYAKGADRWRTMSGVLKPIWEYLTGGESNVMDSTPAAEAKSFINNYFSQDNPLGEHKRFPALFTVYFAGLDHEAHAEGMGAYRNFFTKTTDAKIGVVIKALKNQDEFENKIFIAVADHGMTAMPTDLTFEKKRIPVDAEGNEYPPVYEYPSAEMSCSLNLKGFNKEEVQAPEQANNNLHIWELGEVMLQLNKLYAEIYPGTNIPQKLGYKILTPSQIAGLYKNSVYGAKGTLSEASVIAALNGPMAHIYANDRTSNDWKTHGRTVEDIGYLAEVLRLLLSTDKTPSNLPDMFPEGLIEYILFDTVGLNQNMTYSVDAILVRKSVSPGEKYCVYKGIKPDKSDIECVSLQSNFTNSNYVKAVERINGMENQDRSGDIVLVMRDATSGSATDRYTTGVACKSWHGSLNGSDSYVPFIVSYPGGNRFELEQIIKKTEACGSQMACEGNWKVTDLVKEIIKIQY